MIIKVYDGLQLWKDNPKENHEKVYQIQNVEEEMHRKKKMKVIHKQII